MIEQRTPEWHQARIGRVTGSSVGGILGISPFTTRDAVMRAMVRDAKGAPSEFPNPVPPPVAWGTAMESHAIAEFEMVTSEAVTPAPFVPFEDWLGASPDGYVSDGRLIEVKCPYFLRNDPTPVFIQPVDLPHYMAQMQVQMYVTGYTSCWFFQWSPHGYSNKLIHRDDDWLAANIPRLKQFWAEYIEELDNPDHLQPLRVKIDTPAAHLMVQEWDQLTEAIERATERRKDLLAEMVALAGDRNALIGGRKLTLTTRAGSVSYGKALKELAPGADLSRWTGAPSSYWGLK
jgi:putative phage-type endonuclease